MMPRLTRWGADRRGRKVAPAGLGRGYMLRRRYAQMALPDALEAIEDLEPAASLPAPIEEELPPIDDADLELELEDLDEDGEPLTEGLRQARAPADLSRFVAAMRRKEARPAAIARELEPAASREECRLCGIPGFKGCEHQLPYVPIAAVDLRGLAC